MAIPLVSHHCLFKCTDCSMQQRVCENVFIQTL